MGKSLKNKVIGKKFNRLTVIEVSSRTKKGEAKYLCICECGNEIKTPTARNLIKGITKSCGCLQKEVAREKFLDRNVKYKHYKNKKELTVYYNMKKRCYNEDDRAYCWYGGRGVVMCDSWLESFDNFFEDMGKIPFSNAQLDRIDGDGNYEPSNCRWVTPQQNMLNIKYHDMCGIRKSINKKADDTYYLGMSREGIMRTTYRVYDVELLKEIRKQWVEEYENDPKKYIENTLNKNYRRK